MDSARPSYEAPLRGIQIIKSAYVIAFATSIIAGALRAHLLDRAIRQGVPISHVSASLGVLGGAWQVVGLATSVMLILGWDGLAKGPSDARTAQLTIWGQATIGVGLVLRLATTFIAGLIARSLSPLQVGIVFSAIGSIETLVDLGGYMFMAEALLRLHRHAAQGNTAAELARQGDEGIMYGGLIAAVLLRLIAGRTGPILSALGVGFPIGPEWTSYLLRLPSTIAIASLLLWQLLATEKLLRDHPAALAKANA